MLPNGQIDRPVICKLINRSGPDSIIPYTLGFVRFVAVGADLNCWVFIRNGVQGNLIGQLG